MEMTDINSEKDVLLLVRTFYGKVREDDLLGPIFNSVIVDWEEHFERLTDFWVGNLFFIKKYHGDPLQKHAEVDAAHGGTINEMHFGVWLNLWYETIDQLFHGEKAQMAKNRARNMSTFIHLKMYEARKNNTQK